jgi:hypothetical protein
MVIDGCQVGNALLMADRCENATDVAEKQR